MTFYALFLLSALALCPLAHATESTGNKAKETTAQEKSGKISNDSQAMARQALQQALENLEKSKESDSADSTTSSSTRTSGPISKEELGRLLKETAETGKDLKSERFYINGKEVSRKQFMKKEKLVNALSADISQNAPETATGYLRELLINGKKVTSQEWEQFLKDHPEIRLVQTPGEKHPLEKIATGDSAQSERFCLNGKEVSREQFMEQTAGMRGLSGKEIFSADLDQVLNTHKECNGRTGEKKSALSKTVTIVSEDEKVNSSAEAQDGACPAPQKKQDNLKKQEGAPGLITGSRRSGSGTIDRKAIEQLLNNTQEEEKSNKEPDKEQL